MKKTLTVLAATVALVFIGATPAWAGSPHFVDDQTQATVDGNTLTVAGKEAGLGDEAQVHIVVTALAACINGGGNHPQAANKEAFQAEGDFPVQNGKADFSLTVVATFQPSCSPPMSVAFSNPSGPERTCGSRAYVGGEWRTCLLVKGADGHRLFRRIRGLEPGVSVPRLIHEADGYEWLYQGRILRRPVRT